MKHGPFIFLGVLLSFASSWLVLVFTPYIQLQFLEPVRDELALTEYPVSLAGEAADGELVYAANGCMYCHSQQVRAEEFGGDFQRGWGPRRTVARDYLGDRRIMLGTMRTGPDLANIGVRQPSSEWHHLHLYNPRITSPGSIMPRFAFLYETREVVGQPSADALDLPEDFGLEPGYEVVPTAEARALVSYLLQLDRSQPLDAP